jgi:hypothetical protein
MTVRPTGPHGNTSDDSGPESGQVIPDPRRPLLTQRAAVIFAIAVAIGVGAGVLAYLAGMRPAEAILTGGGACAAAVSLLNKIID